MLESIRDSNQLDSLVKPIIVETPNKFLKMTKNILV